MISSAKFSAIDLMDFMDFSLHPLVMLKIATFTLLKGDTSTAYLLTTPPDPIMKIKIIVIYIYLLIYIITNSGGVFSRTGVDYGFYEYF